MNIFGKEDKELSKPLVFLLDIPKELVELLLIHISVFGDVIGVE